MGGSLEAICPFSEVRWGHFVRRVNRFSIEVRLGNGVTQAYLPNPGRLLELLLPGARVALVGDKKRERRTKATCVGVSTETGPILLHTGKVNDIVLEFLRRGLIPGLKGYEVLKREVSVEEGRLDFLLKKGRCRYFLEAKCCTLFAQQGAFFPDAPTLRGVRHLESLKRRAEEGNGAGVLFFISRRDTDFFLPEWHTDPSFARTLLSVREKVEILPMAFELTEDFQVLPRVRMVSCPLGAVEKELGKGGCYLLVLELQREKALHCGSLGRVGFQRGFYTYVGSAKENLDSRIARHLRERKRAHWHIDHLRSITKVKAALPIRTRAHLECTIAQELLSIADGFVPGFGSSDCRCASHLFFFRRDPVKMKVFLERLFFHRFSRARAFALS